MKNYGLKLEEITPDQFTFGALPKKELVPDGNWSKYLPVPEIQTKGFDTYNCTGFGMTSAIEMLEKRLTGIEENYSDRWVGIVAETRPPGNSPHKVCEAIRKNGLIPEEMLPFENVWTTNEYYSFKDADESKCRKAGQEWLNKWNFGHEWVYHWWDSKETKHKKMMEALKYSPLGVSMTAWYKRNDKFYKPEGLTDNHWIVAVVGYKEKDHWLIFDSYPDGLSYLRQVEWDTDFQVAKRFWLSPNDNRQAQISVIQSLINTISALIAPLTALWKIRVEEEARLETPVPTKRREWAEAIKQYEGWFPNSRSQRNKNPGNLRYANQKGTIGKDKDNFAIFESYEAGWNALLRQLEIAQNGESRVYFPTDSLYMFFSKYAPDEDNNNSRAYAEWVADKLKIDPQTLIKNI